MATITLVLKDTPDVMEKKILSLFILRMNSVLKRAAGSVKRRLGDICTKLIEGSDEYQSLLHGELLGELGIPDVETRLQRILQTIRDSVDVEFTPLINQGSGLFGGMMFKMIRADFLDLLELPEATYTTEKGSNIQWLDWLLTAGDRIIVLGYDVKLDLSPAERARSRTGLALMEHGSGWRVPPEYSGILSDNLITRAFNTPELERLLLQIISEEIFNRL